MPVVVSMLASYSGGAATGLGALLTFVYGAAAPSNHIEGTSMVNNLRGLFVAAAAVTCLSVVPQSRADYPEKPVSVVVGYSAGGPTDALMRAFGPRLTDDWKQPIIVDNKPGATEAIAARHVAKAAPDGYTLLLGTEVPLTMNQFLFSKLAYDPEKDFAPVSFLMRVPLVLVVPAALPVSSLQDFITLAKSRATTKPLAYGSAGLGGVNHLPMVMFEKQNRLELNHVPYKGVAPIVTDLLSGQIDTAWVGPAAAAPFVRDGKLKALVVDAPARIKALPQAPVFSETSVAPVQAAHIFAMVAPAGTPAAIRQKVATALKKIMAEPEFREKYLDPFGYVAVGSTPDELAQYLVKDRSLQAERIRLSGVRLD
jgi:tripartite-type tricarboxylate transporter receptor subunit TctC